MSSCIFLQETLQGLQCAKLEGFDGIVFFADHARNSGHVVPQNQTANEYLPLFFSFLAGAHADLGQFDEAWHWIGEAMARVESSKEKWAEAEIHRVAGEIALRSPVPDASRAESCFNTALAIARQQQAKSWELRTATSYARLMREQGRVREARDLLAPVYGWFTEGFATKDLREAKALLDELGERAPSLTTRAAAAASG